MQEAKVGGLQSKAGLQKHKTLSEKILKQKKLGM
jgi:hypothetical protein